MTEKFNLACGGCLFVPVTCQCFSLNPNTPPLHVVSLSKLASSHSCGIKPVFDKIAFRDACSLVVYVYWSAQNKVQRPQL